jgi:hypothetical protein
MLMKYQPLIIACAAIILLALPEITRAATQQTVEQWDIFEITLPGPSTGNPFVDVTLSAKFTRGDDSLTVPGFYDGDGTYKIRFSPSKPGDWKYLTTSNTTQLDAKSGSFTAVTATGENHGPVQIYKTFHFAYADGSPFFQVGTTCYAWTHQPDELEEQTLKTLADSPFNKLRMCGIPFG